MTHNGFCCNRRSVAATDLRPADSPLTRSPHCASGPVVLGLRTPGAVPLSDFAADRHESCGPRNLQANDDCAIDNSDTSMRAVTRIERSDGKVCWMLSYSSPFRQVKDRQISAGCAAGASKGVLEVHDEHGRRLSSRRSVRLTGCSHSVGGAPQPRSESSKRISR